jgi:hypothetical protein
LKKGKKRIPAAPAKKKPKRKPKKKTQRLARAAIVRDELAVDEPLERGVAAHAELLGHLGLDRGVDLADDDAAVVVLDGRGRLGVLGLEALFFYFFLVFGFSGRVIGFFFRL